VLSGRGLCDELITRPEESYRLWLVVVCDQETSRMKRLKPATGLWKYNQKCCNARKTNKQFGLIRIRTLSVRRSRLLGQLMQRYLLF